MLQPALIGMVLGGGVRLRVLFDALALWFAFKSDLEGVRVVIGKGGVGWEGGEEGGERRLWRRRIGEWWESRVVAAIDGNGRDEGSSLVSAGSGGREGGGTDSDHLRCDAAAKYDSKNGGDGRN